jgi:V/A-type H+-transporting ATPase subunit K
MDKARLIRFVVVSSAAMLMVALLGVALTDAFGADVEPVEAKALNPHGGLIGLAAAVCIAGGMLGAGYAVGKVGSAALGAASERPEITGPALLFVAMGEGIGVLGLVGGVLLMGYIK